MKVLLICIAVFSTLPVHSQDIKILEGIWKVEGKETYEAWKSQHDQLVGESYTIKGGQKHITETLLIKKVDDQDIYIATVPSQNDGAGIPFKLNTEVTDQLQFENPDHDFPNIIIYKPVDEGRLFVKVVGKDGKGFSFYMDKE